MMPRGRIVWRVLARRSFTTEPPGKPQFTSANRGKDRLNIRGHIHLNRRAGAPMGASGASLLSAFVFPELKEESRLRTGKALEV